MATAKPNYKELKRAFESLDEREFHGDCQELFSDKKVRENFSFREMAYECLGHEHYHHMLSNGRRFDMKRAYEAAGEVGTDAFLDIASQWMYQNLYGGYNNEEEFVFTKLIPTRKATNTKGEKVPTYTDIVNPTTFRAEHDAFAAMQFEDDWIFTPYTYDRGGVLQLTEEAIFDDKVGDIAARDKAIGYRIGVDKEIDAINSYVDQNTSAGGGQVISYPNGKLNPWQYVWKGSAPIATYGDNSGAHTWDNLSASTALTDWTSVNTVLILMAGLVNPYTGLPVNFDARHLVVPWGLKATAQRIARATEVRYAGATTGTWVQTIGATPIPLDFEVITSKLFTQRVATTTEWYLGDISKTCQCMEVFPIEIVEAVPMNPDHFFRRIVRSWRVGTMYAYTVWQPRASAKATS